MESRSPAGSASIRLPNSSQRRDPTAHCTLLSRVNLNPRSYGRLAWEGDHHVSGSLIEASALFGKFGPTPVILESTQAEPLVKGANSNTPKGRWRQLYILWIWNPKLEKWREIGRAEDRPLDAAPEMRQLAARAMQQDRWRDEETVAAAADRIWAMFDDELVALGDKRREVLAIFYEIVLSRMLAEGLRPVRKPAGSVVPVPERRSATAG